MAKLPVYRLTVSPDEENGEEIFTALVDDPAIESDFMAFNKQEFIKPNSGESESDWMSRCVPHYINDGKDQDQAVAMCINMYTGMEAQFGFKIADQDRRIITGAVMIPDKRIYRNDNGQEYEVYFTKEDIELFVRKWSKNNRFNAVNEMHDRTQQPQGVYLIESFITDKQRGINAPNALNDKYPDGTWFQSYYVENEQVWQDVKLGKFKGFSIESMFKYAFKSVYNPQNDIKDIVKKLNDYINP